MGVAVRSPYVKADPARQLTRRGQERRTQLVEFASRRFAENGYHPTSVTEIVSGIGVGKGVFYWYFSSKEELFCEILREAHRDLRRRQERAIEGEADPLIRIRLGIEATLSWLAENRHLFTLFQFATTEERFAPMIRHGEQIAVADVARHISEAMDSCRIEACDSNALAHAILGVTNQLARVLLFEEGESPGSVAAVAVQFCMSGLTGTDSRSVAL